VPGSSSWICFGVAPCLAHRALLAAFVLARPFGDLLDKPIAEAGVTSAALTRPVSWPPLSGAANDCPKRAALRATRHSAGCAGQRAVKLVLTACCLGWCEAARNLNRVLKTVARRGQAPCRIRNVPCLNEAAFECHFVDGRHTAQTVSKSILKTIIRDYAFRARPDDAFCSGDVVRKASFSLSVSTIT